MTIVRVQPEADALASPLGRVSPLAKLGIALAWFAGLALTTNVGPPLLLAAVALAGAATIGRVAPLTLARGLAPLWLAAIGIGLFNAMFHPANADTSIVEIARVGPFRLTEPALAAGLGLTTRVIAIASVGVVFARTTDPTRLMDALAQQARVPERFAIGALAAYQAVPQFGEDFLTLRQARRIRGLRGGWHPKLLVGLLVLAIRHGDRLALAMDARAFGCGPRTHFRVTEWARLDVTIVGIAIAALAIAMVLS